MKTQDLRKIFIFRHGETDWNREERFQGHVDIPLNDNGKNQAKNLALQLQTRGIEAILSSDLSRAQQTAEILSKTIGNIPIHTESRLREAHLGEAQGKTFSEIKSHFGEELTRRWRSSHPTDADISYPGGETGAQIMNRALTAIESFLREYPYSTIGVSTHGGVIRRVMQAILPPGSPSVPIPNCVFYEIAFDLEQNSWFKI